METKSLNNNRSINLNNRSTNRKGGKLRNFYSKRVRNKQYLKKIIVALFATSNPLLWLCIYNSISQIKNFAIVILGMLKETGFK